MEEFRELFREQRQKLGFSQKRLAEMAEITQPFVNEIEKGKKSPSLEVFFKLCELLQIKVILEVPESSQNE